MGVVPGLDGKRLQGESSFHFDDAQATSELFRTTLALGGESGAHGPPGGFL
jgi:hypothetical protein